MILRFNWYRKGIPLKRGDISIMSLVHRKLLKGTCHAPTKPHWAQLTSSEAFQKKYTSLTEYNYSFDRSLSASDCPPMQSVISYWVGPARTALLILALGDYPGGALRLIDVILLLPSVRRTPFYWHISPPGELSRRGQVVEHHPERYCETFRVVG